MLTFCLCLFLLSMTVLASAGAVSVFLDIRQKLDLRGVPSITDVNPYLGDEEL